MCSFANQWSIRFIIRHLFEKIKSYHGICMLVRVFPTSCHESDSSVVTLIGKLFFVGNRRDHEAGESQFSQTWQREGKTTGETWGKKKGKESQTATKRRHGKRTCPDGQRYRKSVRYYMNFAISWIRERDSLPSCDECNLFIKRFVSIQYTKCLTGSYSFSQAGPAIKVAQSIDVINVNTLMNGRLLVFIPVPLSICIQMSINATLIERIILSE